MHRPPCATTPASWYKACLGDAPAVSRDAADRSATGCRRARYAKATGPVRVDGFADSGSRLYEVIGCSFDSEGAFDAGCRIDAVPTPAYAPVRAPLR